MIDTTSFTWILAEHASAPAIRGAVIALEKIGAVDDADVRILTVSEDRGVEVPEGINLPNGEPLPAGIITVENVPPQGILFQGTL